MCFEPVEVFLRIFDHTGLEVGAENGETREEGLLEDDTGAAEGVEKDFPSGEGATEVDENLGELRGKHADTGVAGGADAVAVGVGGDVLDGEDTIPIVVEFNQFDVVPFLGKLVVVGGGGREDGVAVLEDTDGAGEAGENLLQLQRLEGGGATGGAAGKIGNTEGDFAFGEGFQVVEGGGVEFLCEFQRTAEAGEGGRGGRVEGREGRRELADVGKLTLELGEREGGEATEDGEISLHGVIITFFAKS